ncbi:MAG: hypothetical protein LUF82_02530, partial [Clostridia bacterium]|nr:hypothetical protein [Clostridia bacterium]
YGLLGIVMAIILMSFIFQGYNYYAKAEENKSDWTLADCENVALFIKENFDTFVTEYNKTLEEDDDKLLATYIEDTKYVRLVEDKKFAAYLDFDGDNGYVVVTGLYNIYELKTKGDLQCLKEYDGMIYYSYGDGFLYLDDEMTYQKFNYQNYSSVSKIKSSYVDSQGRLLENYLDDYLEDEYSGYTLIADFSVGVSPTAYTKQTRNSYYIMNELDSNGNATGDYATECNCTLTAVYNLFFSLSLNGFCSSVPYANRYDMSEEIVNDVFYSKFGNGTAASSLNEDSDEEKIESSVKEFDKYYWSTAEPSVLKKINEVYKVARDYAVANCGYSPDEGMYDSYIPEILEYTADYYSVALTAESSSNMYQARQSILDNRAAYMCLTNSNLYENHATAMIGYKYISYETGWWIFSSTKHNYLYEMADGWDGNSAYYDENANSGSISCCYVNFE